MVFYLDLRQKLLSNFENLLDLLSKVVPPRTADLNLEFTFLPTILED